MVSLHSHCDLLKANGQKAIDLIEIGLTMAWSSRLGRNGHEYCNPSERPRR